MTGWVGAQIVAVLRQIEVELANHKNLTPPKRRGKGGIWSRDWLVSIDFVEKQVVRTVKLSSYPKPASNVRRL